MITPEQSNSNPIEGVDRVAKFWAEIPEADGVTAALWRIPEKGQPEFLDTYFLTKDAYPDEYAFYAEVKAEHGGGKYELRVTTAGGQWVARPAFCIGGKPKRQDNEDRQPGQVSELAVLMQRSDERFAQVMAEIREMRQQPAAEPVNPLEQITKLSEVMRNLTQGQQPQQKEKSLIEQAVEKKFLAFLDSEMGGSEGGESGFGWVKDLAPIFGPFLQGGKASGDEGNAPPALPSPQQVLLQKLGRMLAGLVQVAKYHGDPAATVADVKAQAGDYWPAFLEIVKRPDALQLATQLVPAVAEHEQWFTQWRAALLKAEGEKGGDITEQPPKRQPAKRAGRAKVASQ